MAEAWQRVMATLDAAGYALEGEFEFEREPCAMRMYYHGSLQKCVTFLETCQDWIREAPHENVSAKLLLDKAGSEVTVFTPETPASVHSLQQLFILTQRIA
jgi:hypothetical protein